jgi:8-amino-7-oxononanoate synthase
LSDLVCLLSRSHAKRKVIVTEHLFSMDGDFAPLEAIQDIARRYDCFLIIDAAHTTGLWKLELPEYEHRIVVHTCGKALGGYGAFVSCSRDFKNLMLCKSRTQIFSTALSPLAVEHIRLSVERLSDPGLINKFHNNVAWAHSSFKNQGIQCSQSQITPLILSSNQAVIKAAEILQDNGFFIKAIRSPTVARGQERLRITISSRQSEKQIEQLTQILPKVIHESLCHRH